MPIVIPGGSSSGSAVAVAAGLAAAAIGTETSGSLLSPAGQNGVVTVKPTVGLISRAGIVPIAHSQDTAGPLTRTVRDAAILLNVLAVADPLDPATAELQRPPDYTGSLDKDGLRGARIGVPSDPSDPANDVYYGALPPRAAAVMREAVAVLEAQGATIVRANIPTGGWIGGPGTEMAILNRNPESPTRDQPARRPIVFVYELKHDLNLYLRDWATETGMRSLADIIAFNAAHANRALRFGQDIFLAADATRGDLSEPEYISARQMDLRAARTLGLDTYMDAYRLDAVLFPGTTGAAIAAKGGYPSVQVPAGFVVGCPRQGYPRISLRCDLHRPRLERAPPVAPRLRLRTSNPGPASAPGISAARIAMRALAAAVDPSLSALIPRLSHERRICDARKCQRSGDQNAAMPTVLQTTGRRPSVTGGRFALARADRGACGAGGADRGRPEFLQRAA